MPRRFVKDEWIEKHIELLRAANLHSPRLTPRQIDLVDIARKTLPYSDKTANFIIIQGISAAFTDYEMRQKNG